MQILYIPRLNLTAGILLKLVGSKTTKLLIHNELRNNLPMLFDYVELLRNSFWIKILVAFEPTSFAKAS